MATASQASSNQHGVFLGNLDDSGSKEVVATMIARFIRQMTGWTVDFSTIHVRQSIPCKCYTASISFSSQVEQHRVLDTLRNSPNIPQGLVKHGRKLKVDTYKPKIPQTQLQNPKELQDDGDSLLKGHQLGNETRILEFKLGGGDLKVALKRHLAKYTCAFLNGQGGSLMIGVDDTGTVQGVHCDRKLEDNIRISIDNIIHQFDPPVLPQMYEVEFIPVRDKFGIQANLKVLEVCVNPGRPNTLYETPNGEVYIRRDGSVRGPLRPKDIQEWCRLKFTNDFNTVESELQHKVDDLQQRLQKLESDRQDPEGSSVDGPKVKKTSSSICIIS